MYGDGGVASAGVRSIMPMSRPTKLELPDVNAWLIAHPEWTFEAGRELVRVFVFPDFASALAFVLRVGIEAEKKDHHPDIELGWGRARVLWSTHDAGGVTSLDLELATLTDSFARA